MAFTGHYKGLAFLMITLERLLEICFVSFYDAIKFYFVHHICKSVKNFMPPTESRILMNTTFISRLTNSKTIHHTVNVLLLSCKVFSCTRYNRVCGYCKVMFAIIAKIFLCVILILTMPVILNIKTTTKSTMAMIISITLCRQ